MADSHPAAPDAVVKEKRRISSVWIIPIVAVVVGAFLTWKSVSERGPTFEMTFRSADGLEAGKTKIKFRELELGVVEELHLSEDLLHIQATARINPQYAHFLTEETRFWVVRARVTAGNVSGLSTLLSGAYIGIDPVLRGKKKKKFVGLEQPPLVTSQAEGTRFLLKAKKMGSLDVGAPVLFRQLPVGEITRVALADDDDGVLVNVYVHAPYDKRVRTTSKWWNTSGFDATINQNGLRIETESFMSMLIGGIAFDNALDSPGEPVESNAMFGLYASKDDTEAPIYTIRERFLAYFDGNVKGLEKGSLIEFRGIRVGEVVDVKIQYDSQTGDIQVPVVLEFEPERVHLLGEIEHLGGSVQSQAEKLVGRGLRARLESGNLLTGTLVVALDFYPNAAPAQIREGGVYPEIPTLPKRLDEIAANVAKLVDKFEAIPIDQMINEMSGALRALRGTLEQTQVAGKAANKSLIPALTGTIEEAQQTLKTVQKTLEAAEGVAKNAGRLVAPSSPVSTELMLMMNELTETMRAVRLLVEQLDRNPESLIMGREDK